MKRNLVPKAAGFLLLCVCLLALLMGRMRAAEDALIFDPAPLDLRSVVPPPPPQDSPSMKAELEQLHRIEESRTPEQVAAAQADEKEQDIFVYRTVLGDKFSAADLPLTAALSAAVHKEEPAAGNPLKLAFHRPRPYQSDRTLHPVCDKTVIPNSYPSGHSISGYLEGLTLAEMVPEKRDQILARADDYANNRLVCGVHYPSDIATGRQVAYAVFGALMATPEFRSQLAAAKTETRKKLGM